MLWLRWDHGVQSLLPRKRNSATNQNSRKKLSQNHGETSWKRTWETLSRRINIVKTLDLVKGVLISFSDSIMKGSAYTNWLLRLIILRIKGWLYTNRFPRPATFKCHHRWAKGTRIEKDAGLLKLGTLVFTKV